MPSTDGQPGVLSPLPLPQLDSGPFFSYALQWIAFGIMAPLAIGYLIYNELRPSPELAGGEAQTSQRPGRRRKMSVAEAVAEEERREREQAANNS